MKHSIELLFVFLSCILVTLSCTDAEQYISHRYPCRFIFEEAHHPTSLLFAAIKSPGTYVSVTTTGDGHLTVRHVYVTSNAPNTPQEDNVIRTDRENSASFLLGASNAIGLIVGCTNFNGPTAYDRSCPNCTTLTALDFSGNRQQVTCSRCKRDYSLETGVPESGGDPLLRYVVNYSGGRLVIGN